MKFPVFKPHIFLLGLVFALMIIIFPVTGITITYDPEGDGEYVLWNCAPDAYNTSQEYFVYENETLEWVTDLTSDKYMYIGLCHMDGSGQMAVDKQHWHGNTSGTFQFKYTDFGAGHLTTYFFQPQYGNGNNITVWYMYNSTAQRPDVTADFNYTVNGYEITTIDNSSGMIEHRIWNWGDGNVTYEDNPATHIFSTDGIYGVNLYVNNSYSSDDISKDIQIGNQNLTYDRHLLVDIVDENGTFVTNANIGIFDENNEWRNSTCLSGACGFMDSGASHQYPLEFGNVYTIAAWKDEMGSDSEEITFTHDYQQETLHLGYETNITNTTPHMVLEVVDYSTGMYAENVNITIHDECQDTTWSQTVGTGLYTYTHSDAAKIQPLEYGCGYHLEAQKDGYREYYTGNETASTDTMLYTNYQEVGLAILPENSIISSNMTWNIDYKDSETKAYISGCDVGIYDYVHDEWRNATCIDGACGYKSTGANYQYPLQKDMVYLIHASKTGYFTINRNIRFSPNTNGEMYTEIFMDKKINYYQFVTPTTFVPLVTINGNISPDESSIPYPTLIVYPTMPLNFPITLDENINATEVREHLQSNLPESELFLQAVDNSLSFIGVIFYWLVTIITYPIFSILNIYTYAYSLVIGMWNGYAPLTLLISYTMNNIFSAIPVKLINAFTYILGLNLLYEIWMIQHKIKRHKS